MKVDLTGQRFHNLTVIKKAASKTGSSIKWECICDCGKTTYVTTSNLRTGHTKSCGCLKNRSNALDLKGERFGYLTVYKRIGSTPNRKALWRCKCDCGNFTNVRASDLRSGNTMSCGCMKQHFALRNCRGGMLLCLKKEEITKEES